MKRYTRRVFLRSSVMGLALATLPADGGWKSEVVSHGLSAKSLNLNTDWLFGGEYVPGSTDLDFNDKEFERVTLPHCVAHLSWRNWDPKSWEKRWIYRRHFNLPDKLGNIRFFLRFEGVMTGASVYINGQLIGRHLGGYLPFKAEITQLVSSGHNVVAVIDDARWGLDVPPDRPGPSTSSESVAPEISHLQQMQMQSSKIYRRAYLPETPYPSSSVDFWQPGGIYREAYLEAVPPIFIADVFAKPVDVLDSNRRRVEVECTIDASVVPRDPVQVQVELYGHGMRSSISRTASIRRRGRNRVMLTITGLEDVNLWDIEDPKLYELRVTLRYRGKYLHSYHTRIGFREARFTKEGFFLNGRRLKLFGLNRHQFYPYAGGAMPARVQRKDAEILKKELNCNMVRCSHYPQSPHFLDACDELGLMVWEEAPGWGYLGDQKWLGRALRDIKQMIIRDRNRPSVIIWGVRLNETPNDSSFYSKAQAVAKALDDSRQTTGAMIGSLYATKDFQQDVFSYNDYHKNGNWPTLNPPRADYPYMVSEAVGSLSGPYHYYRRTDPAEVQSAQATAHAIVHDIAASDERYCGLLAWSGFDYESGTGYVYEEVKWNGVVDLFRVPKLGAAFYISQVDPRVRPVIEPGFYWDFGPNSPAQGPGENALIWSNCDRLELFVGEEHYASVEPDSDSFPHLRYPPFRVDLRVDGASKPDLRIDGYLQGRRVISRRFSSDASRDRFLLTVDDAEIRADGSDATRAAFRVVDAYGAPRPFAGGEVFLSLKGPGDLVGQSPFPLGDNGGVGAVWIRSQQGKPGAIHIRAEHSDLGNATAMVRSVSGRRA
ncbi:glycoside hydrolase family 2 protein [Rubrobacter calidifluminis]|uniref:glycoside hydrolase family 2 protein n=1 Tax=Rubrobacter calidifluminis TaxID=1392640 RepID=UPI0023612A34|nr:glycoside hydrolase family 2 TIM barrel-domain containing protein [Rubrobacter calidifluminis]